MDDDSAAPAISLLMLAAAISWAIHAGWFYQTGSQWFDACWRAKHSTSGPQTPDEAVSWGKCKYTTEKSLFDAGFVFAGNPAYAVTPELKAVVNACPSNYSDIPMSGPQFLAVDMAEEQGGPNILDKFLPASLLIVRAFKTKWPECPAVRLANGFPKIVEVRGSFQWAAPCKPCEAEQAAIKDLR